MIWSIWTLRDNKVDVKEKLIQLWEEISSWADSNHREFDKRVASRLCMWSVFVDELNEQTMNLLLRAVSYADLELENNAYILIKELKRLVEPYPDQVADIFIRMLDVFAPIYEQEDIEYVIDKLYCKGGDVRQKANTICDRYVKCRIPCDYIPKRSYPLFRTRQILNDWLTQNPETVSFCSNAPASPYRRTAQSWMAINRWELVR
ncbi:hypothetical protein [Thiolapillus sp.]|uniref:hypothetical protein n=1 Tax=Thiolapillus sp. TaxID=2017437 RepID=UPI003AF57D48